ncbi:hypothetical protein [Clostridium beijerinckii]|uniref:hypothetical protein n=1 Tax=Clostridium beijerinckii TaxID=1520 RepID=UPI001570E6AB|nr:hypothetical protein [Clostridium beijerinckii]NRU52422.1 hypothetical protein [Clostridium beijerinckii]NYC69133.1 hypothetical protein [Clostridium beijerinckii]
MEENKNNKVKLFEVTLDPKTNDISVIFENSMLEILNVDKDKFYKCMNNDKGLENEIRKICKNLIESVEK